MAQDALTALRGFLPNNRAVTYNEIEKQVDFILSNEIFKNVNKEQLIKQAEVHYSIRIDDYKIIENSNKKTPWIADKKAGIKWDFWNRYRDYLESNKNFPTNIINELDRLTDRILDGTFDPTARIEIAKRGLVVGQVQSGKTSNYTGLICKASDAGFKLIIVLAGMHNNLRSQTQLRLDEGFLGFDTQTQRVFSPGQDNLLGVGVNNKTTRANCVAHSITSSLDKGDFGHAALKSFGMNFETQDVIIAVVKKNTAVLKNLYDWLNSKTEALGTERFITDKSLLLIDDEADNASINTSKNNVTAINKHIRNILKLFKKNAYIGYTATPFANVFIPIDEQGDIFPRDFIINLPAPSNYIGPEQVFGFSPLEEDEFSETVLPITHKIEDAETFIPNTHTNKTAPDSSELPDSLQLAIKSFIITCAIRRLRGQEKAHNSMLIHITRYTTWQKHTFECVQATFDKYNNAIKFNDIAIFEEFRQVFEGNIPNHKNFVQVSEQILDCSLSGLDAQIQVHKWEDVKQELHKACSKIHVRIINGGSKDTLEYFNHKDGLSVIAIGGDKLSRGLTLEGLSVSYFLRASKMYDTLMQMGRWFGYRQGYVDLCRLFTTSELNKWFCHITEASEELRQEFDYMTNVAGATPEKYALKVRTHPGLLQITASNKLRDVEKIQVSFSARLVETYEFVKNKAIFKQNFSHTHQFVESLGENDRLNFPKDFVWKNISASKITAFLSNYQVEKDQPLRKAEPSFLVGYISKLVNLGELTNWSVALINNSQTKETHQYTINNEKINIGLTVRNADENCSTDTSTNRQVKGIYYLKKSHIISPNHEYIDLDKNIVAEKIQEERLKGKKSTYLSGEVVRNELRNAKNPLLMIYSLDAKNTKGLEDIQDLGVPIIGFAISFPKSNQKVEDITLSYAIQTQLLPYFDLDIALEEDDYEN